jgi:hypothetical protein
MGRKINNVLGRTVGNTTGGSLTASLVSYFTCPVNTTAIVTLYLTNRTSSPIAVNVNLSTTGSENLGGYIEWQSSIDAFQSLEKTGIILSGGQQILMLGTTNVSYVISVFTTTNPQVLDQLEPTWSNFS